MITVRHVNTKKYDIFNDREYVGHIWADVVENDGEGMYTFVEDGSVRAVLHNINFEE